MVFIFAFLIMLTMAMLLVVAADLDSRRIRKKAQKRRPPGGVKMRCHDPRLSDDRFHRIETTNPELIAAERMRHKSPTAKINWDAVKAGADNCDRKGEIITARRDEKVFTVR